MWIVRLALRRPYTFVVVSLLIALLGMLSIVSMPTDIFPSIDIPVVSVIWSYGGLSATEVEDRITTVVERAMTTTVSNIEHIESQSIRGNSVIKLYFQPHADVAAAVAQVTAICQTLIRPLPTGISPPLILQYNAAAVPVVLLSLGSDKLSEQEINDFGNNFIRTQLVAIQGAAVPVPYGGKSRVVNIDLDPDALYARGISPDDVNTAIQAQNIVRSPGTAKMGPIEYDVAIDSSPQLLNQLNEIPIRYANSATVYLRDVAYVHDGYTPQTNVVRRDGRRSALLPILTSGNASTLSVVNAVRELMPKIQAGLPKALDISFLFDQSVFVRASISGVLREGTIAACLTALMILLFLHSWRSTLIVATSIPLSIFASIGVLHLLQQTLNVMTLGGMSLAVGILVDDATVEIENNHRHMDLGTPLRQAILDGAAEVATPALVSTLSICIVFVPIFLLSGVGGYLFSPLAMAVVFAMLASYFLSRTLVPTMFLYLMGAEEKVHADEPKRRRSLLGRFSDGFERSFASLTDGYTATLAWSLEHRAGTALGFALFALLSCGMYPFVGRDFFPSVDAGQLRLHVRCPPGTRIERTELYFQRVEDAIRKVIPVAELEVINDNIGLPNNINLALSDNVTAGPSDGEILVALRKDHHPTADYLEQLRLQLPREFPDLEFFAQPADIVSQILNFGLPAPIDVQISGPLAEAPKNYRVAEQIAREVSTLPGAVDVHVHQIDDSPRLMVQTDRVLAQQSGLAEQDMANSLSVSLAGSGTSSTNFWLNYKNGVSYQVVTQTPQHRISSIDELNRTPISTGNRGAPQLLGNLATITRATTPLSLSHYNVQPVFDVFANVQGTDLGRVADAVEPILARYRQHISQASTIRVRGQVQSMQQAFVQMAFGISFAVLLVYFLMVVNFQSWLDPLIILSALPGAAAGILWALFVTRTTISVPSLMGCIMAIGVATSNSILMVSFANEQRAPRFGSLEASAAALAAGRTRLRPVLMTALAMLLGMLPISLGLGEGGEQNAPLGRAVIGGLLVASCYTLFFVPVVYSLLRQGKARQGAEARRGVSMNTQGAEARGLARVKPARTRTIGTIGGALLTLCIVLLAVGIVPRMRASRALAAAAQNAKQALPAVYVIHAAAAAKADLTLAGTTEAFQDATVYARTSGYVSRRLADIGDVVQAGQLLAEIASPEIDQQLRQAEADLRQSQKALELQKATRDLAQVTRARYQAADAERAVAKELVDQSGAALKTAEASVAAADANVESNAANVQRLQAMTAFERVVAPFGGTIIRRNVNEGALITAGSPTSSAAPTPGNDALSGLFEVAQIDVLRVFVNAPQVDAPNVKLGMPVQILVRGHLGDPVTGSVTRTASALDPATRTLLVEIDIPNASHGLLPGMFVYVGFSIAPSGIHWRVPATAVVVDAEGTRVVTVGPGNKLHFQPVALGRDFGNAIDIQAGLRGTETIVQQPRVSLQEGQLVRPLAASSEVEIR